MNPWLETAGIVLVILFGIFLGRVFSSFRRSRWMYGYFLSLALLMTLVTARYFNFLAFEPPFSWLVAGRLKFVVLALVVTMGLTTPLSRLRHRSEKVVVCILMVVVVTWFSVLPFLVPALIKEHLSNINTIIDINGVCFQTENYTCGPAAAVTALRKLGLSAQEGEIAVLSRSSPFTGTLALSLCNALQNRYIAEGLKCQYRSFDSLVQLKDAGVTLAVVKAAFLRDHCVAVLEVSDQIVLVADPVTGRQLLSHKEFEKIWRFSGIVLERDSAQSI